jgi:hypothetical protein
MLKEAGTGMEEDSGRKRHRERVSSSGRETETHTLKK